MPLQKLDLISSSYGNYLILLSISCNATNKFAVENYYGNMSFLCQVFVCSPFKISERILDTVKRLFCMFLDNNIILSLSLCCDVLYLTIHMLNLVEWRNFCTAVAACIMNANCFPKNFDTKVSSFSFCKLPPRRFWLVNKDSNSQYLGRRERGISEFPGLATRRRRKEEVCHAGGKCKQRKDRNKKTKNKWCYILIIILLFYFILLPPPYPFL